jgi:hypothetical protein
VTYAKPCGQPLATAMRKKSVSQGKTCSRGTVADKNKQRIHSQMHPAFLDLHKAAEKTVSATVREM